MLDQKTANEIFKTKMLNRTKGDKGSDYELIGNYKKSNEKVEILHKECGNTFLMTPNRFLCGDNCPKCRGKRISKKFVKDTKWFNSKIIELNLQDEYKLLEEYKGTHQHINILHVKCGNILNITPNAFLNGVRCKYCSEFYFPKKTTNDFKEEILKIDPKYLEYEILSEYEGVNKNLLIRHKICGKTFYRTPTVFKKTPRCPRCETSSAKAYYEDLVERFNNLEKSKDYELLTSKSEFKHMCDKILIRHKKCGNNFQMNIFHYEQGNTCPYCATLKKDSISSQILEKFFIENNITYEKEKQFETCKIKRCLSFDYYLPEFNCLIEYDGQQHFMVKFSEKSFNEGRIRDEFKNKWCKENNITLIRISYKLNNEEIDNLLFNLFLNEDESSTTISNESTIIENYWKQVIPYYYNNIG